MSNGYLFLICFLANLTFSYSINAQTFGWSASPGILIDSEFVDGTEVGPSLSGEFILLPNEKLSYFLSLSLARTDFSVAEDQLHRNWGIPTLGLRYALPGKGVNVSLSLGLGAIIFDDVNETDPGFTSSANAEELLMPSLEGRLPLKDAWHLKLAAQYLMTDWWNAILDPNEGALNHRFQVSLGVEFR